jgi:hypothetical protein
LSINNVLLVRKDNDSEATGLLIDYNYVNSESDSEAANHSHIQAIGSGTNIIVSDTPEDTSIGDRVAATSAEAPSDTSEVNAIRTVHCLCLIQSKYL